MEMSKQKLESVIESILFLNGDAIKRSDLTEKLGITDPELSGAITKLKQKYNAQSGIILLEIEDKLQFATNSENETEVAICLNPLRERALTKATMETLSIIAYKQPITRLDIEEIRGVSSDYAVQILLDHNLISVVGRKDAVGKPLLFGTTDEFLKRFNLSKISDLPDRETLLSRIKEIKTEETDSLYREFEISSEEIIPEKIKRKLQKENEMVTSINKSDFV